MADSTDYSGFYELGRRIAEERERKILAALACWQDDKKVDKLYARAQRAGGRRLRKSRLIGKRLKAIQDYQTAYRRAVLVKLQNNFKLMQATIGLFNGT